MSGNHKNTKINATQNKKNYPFEARKPYKPLSNKATTSSPNNLNREKQKQLMYPPLQPEIMHDLPSWSESEVKVTNRPLRTLPELSNSSPKEGETTLL